MGDVSASALVGAGRPTFGALPRRYRQVASLSQEALAERAGLSVDAIGVIERGKRGAPRSDTIALLAQALDMTRVGTPGAFSSPGVLSERSTFVVARGCHAATDEHEDIPPVVLTPDDALALIASPGPDAQPAPNPEDVKTMLLLVLARQARLI